MTPRYRPALSCSAHPRSRLCRARECAWCGRPADLTTGILQSLYPGQTMCSGCGRRQVFCTCQRVAS